MIVTLAEMKDRVGETGATYDSFLTEQIILVQQAMEEYCGRKFDETSYTQTYYRDEMGYERVPDLFMYHYPLVTLTQIDEGDDTLTSDEYRVKGDTGKIARVEDDSKKYWFRNGAKKVIVQYTAGYTDLTAPKPLKEVIFGVVGQNYQKQVAGLPLDFGQGVQRISVAGVMSIDFDYTLNSNEQKTGMGMIIGTYQNVLDYYKSERVVSGEIHENYVA
jgi:hypothetical protein